MTEYDDPKTVLRNEHPLHRVLEYVDEVNPDLYVTLVVDLAVAHTGQVFPFAGDVLSVESIDGTASIAFNDAEKPQVSLNKNRRFVTPFRRFYITNTAQATKQMTLIIGRDAKFDAAPLPANKLTDTSGLDIEPASMASTPVIYNVTMTLADTEYSQALPANTRRFVIQTRDGTGIRLAFVTGKVAVPVEPYLTVKTNSSYSEDMVQSSSLTLFMACAAAGKVAEIACWS